MWVPSIAPVHPGKLYFLINLQIFVNILFYNTVTNLTAILLNSLLLAFEGKQYAVVVDVQQLHQLFQ